MGPRTAKVYVSETPERTGFTRVINAKGAHGTPGGVDSPAHFAKDNSSMVMTGKLALDQPLPEGKLRQ